MPGCRCSSDGCPLGIATTLAAHVAQGAGNGPVAAAVSTWPALALAGSYEPLRMIIHYQSRGSGRPSGSGNRRLVPRYDLGKPPDENTPSKHETNMQVKRHAWIVCHNPSWSRNPHLYAVTHLT